MRLLVINPNTTASMTRKIGEAAKAVASPSTEVTAVNPAHGPVSIEGFYDEAFCVPGLLEEVRKGVDEGYDGFLVACFGDPGLDACREISTAPVIGICEAAMHVASLVAHRFTVVTTNHRSVPRIGELAHRYGVERRVPKPRRRSRRWPAGRCRRRGPRRCCWAVPAWPTCRRACPSGSACPASTVSPPGRNCWRRWSASA
jgi:allantoin racemase